MRMLIVAVFSSLALAFSSGCFADAQHGDATAAPVSKLAATQAGLRDLWVGHIFWVREVVRAMASKNTSAAEVAEAKTVENAKQIAAAIDPFYGKPASDQLFKLLAGHYTAVKSHANATIAGNPTEAEKAFDQLAANAGEISAFLSKANPHLPQQALNSLLMAHGGHHVQQNQQIAKGDVAAESRTWEEMKVHIYGISDALASALAKQFPAKF
jgi:hypothetical protein